MAFIFTPDVTFIVIPIIYAKGPFTLYVATQKMFFDTKQKQNIARVMYNVHSSSRVAAKGGSTNVHCVS